MDWHCTLTFKCRLLPEFIDFIQNEYLETLFDANYLEESEKKEAMDKEYNCLPATYKVLIDIWRELNIGINFYAYNLKDNEFFCQISKKIICHKGDLHDDYEKFMKEIIVFISSEILFCRIQTDDFGNIIWDYSDDELRNRPLRLRDKVKIIKHIYSEDNNAIIETRIVYKQLIKKEKESELNRIFDVFI